PRARPGDGAAYARGRRGEVDQVQLYRRIDRGRVGRHSDETAAATNALQVAQPPTLFANDAHADSPWQVQAQVAALETRMFPTRVAAGDPFQGRQQRFAMRRFEAHDPRLAFGLRDAAHHRPIDAEVQELRHPLCAK